MPAEAEPNFDEPFWQEVARKATWFGKIFTPEEIALWDDPDVASRDVIALTEGALLDEELAVLNDEKNSGNNS